MLSTALLCAVAAPAHAVLTAHFKVTSYQSGCLVDDHDEFPLGEPDRYFRMGIFDNASDSVLNACDNGCAGDTSPTTPDGKTLDFCSVSTGCTTVDVPDQTIEKVIPAGQGAYFYFGLYDDDSPLESDDLLGDNWLFLSASSSGTAFNNNVSSYYPDHPITTICGRDVEGTGNASNLKVSYSAWFEDSTAPVVDTPAVHLDDGVETENDNDTTLSFNVPASDPDSGVSSKRVFLFNQSTATYAYFDEPVSTGLTQVTFCPAGCTRALTPQNNVRYSFQYRAINGSNPSLLSPDSSESGYVEVLVDLVSPVATFVSPAADAWRGANFNVSVNDTDSGSGIDTTACEYRITSNAVLALDWTARACTSAAQVTVGPSSKCHDEGASKCLVEVRNKDEARRQSTTASRTFSIDFTNDTVSGLEARTEPGGAVIPANTPQPDATPFMSWTASTSVSPIAGYSYAWDVSADCKTETAGTSASFALNNGAHTFAVRAIDQAGNCGAASTFVLIVDLPSQIFIDSFEDP